MAGGLPKTETPRCVSPVPCFGLNAINLRDWGGSPKHDSSVHSPSVPPAPRQAVCPDLRGFSYPPQAPIGAASVRVGADHLPRGDRVDADPDRGTDRVLHEPDRAIAQAHVDTAGVPAARAG